MDTNSNIADGHAHVGLSPCDTSITTQWFKLGNPQNGPPPPARPGGRVKSGATSGYRAPTSAMNPSQLANYQFIQSDAWKAGLKLAGR